MLCLVARETAMAVMGAADWEVAGLVIGMGPDDDCCALLVEFCITSKGDGIDLEDKGELVPLTLGDSLALPSLGVVFGLVVAVLFDRVDI